MDFDDMGLKETILQGIYAFGFENPSPIQQKAILPGALPPNKLDIPPFI